MRERAGGGEREGWREIQTRKEKEKEIEHSLIPLSDSTDINNDVNLQDSLKAYEPELNVPRNEFNLQHFSYKNFGILNLTIGHINATNYTGLTVSSISKIIRAWCNLIINVQGNIYFNLSNGLRTVDKSIIYQYQPTDTPESPPCSSHGQIPQSRITKLNNT